MVQEKRRKVKGKGYMEEMYQDCDDWKNEELEIEDMCTKKT